MRCDELVPVDKDCSYCPSVMESYQFLFLCLLNAKVLPFFETQVTYQKVKDTQSKHFKGNADMPMVVEPVQHSDTETVQIKENITSNQLFSDHTYLYFV
jgi:hypothetical protein